MGQPTRILHIKKWREFQHYTKRTPPWIKLHTKLLADSDFRSLQDSAKLTAILLWLLVAREGSSDGSIEEWRVTRNSLGMLSKLNLQPLISSKFIWYSDASKSASKSLCISVSLDSKGESEGETIPKKGTAAWYAWRRAKNDEIEAAARTAGPN